MSAASEGKLVQIEVSLATLLLLHLWRLCLNYLTLKDLKGDSKKKVLIITDHFSRYVQAIPTRNETAKTTARVFFDNYIVHDGFPARIHSDQGSNFESDLIKQLCNIARVEKS